LLTFFLFDNEQAVALQRPCGSMAPSQCTAGISREKLAIVLTPDEFGKLIEVSYDHPVSFHSCDDLRIPEILDELLAALQLV